MKRYIAIAGAALLWAGCSEQRSAPEQQPAAATPEETAGVGGAGAEGTGAPIALADRPFIGDAQVIAGKIERVETGRLQIRDDQGERISISVHPNTLVVIDGEQRTVGELREGTEVRAYFDVTPDVAAPDAQGAAEIQIETVAPAQR